MKRRLSSVVRDGDKIERIGPYPALKSSGAVPTAEEGRRGPVLWALAALIFVVLLSALNGGGCDHPNSQDFKTIDDMGLQTGVWR